RLRDPDPRARTRDLERVDPALVHHRDQGPQEVQLDHRPRGCRLPVPIDLHTRFHIFSVCRSGGPPTPPGRLLHPAARPRSPPRIRRLLTALRHAVPLPSMGSAESAPACRLAPTPGAASPARPEPCDEAP